MRFPLLLVLAAFATAAVSAAAAAKGVGPDAAKAIHYFGGMLFPKFEITNTGLAYFMLSRSLLF